MVVDFSIKGIKVMENMVQISKETVDLTVIIKVIRINLLVQEVNIIQEKTVKHGVIKINMMMIKKCTVIMIITVIGEDCKMLMLKFMANKIIRIIIKIMVSHQKIFQIKVLQTTAILHQDHLLYLPLIPITKVKVGNLAECMSITCISQLEKMY